MNERLTTRDIAEVLAYQTGLDKKRAEEFINLLSSYILQNIEKNKGVKILGLGTFKIVLVRERESVHIQTGERFVIPAHHKLSFIPDKDFKEQINRPFAFFEPIEATEDYAPKKVSFKRDSDNKVIDETADKQEGSPNTEEAIVNIEEPDVKENTSISSADNDDAEVRIDDYFADVVDITTVDEEAEVDPILIDKEDAEVVIAKEEVVVDSDEDVVSASEDEEEKSLTDNTSSEYEDKLIAASYRSSGRSRTARKKKKVPKWLLYVLVLIIVFAGAGVGMFAFLYYIHDRTTEKSLSAIRTGSSDTYPTPIGSSMAIDSISNGDTILIDELFLPNRENLLAADDEKINDSIVKASDKNNKTTMDWFADLPEIPKTESKRVSQPNEATERKARPSNVKAESTSSDNKKNTTEKAPVAEEKAKTTPATTEKIIPEKVRMTAGLSLRQVAETYYGDAVFWVYIYEFNKERIKNYNNIPVGTDIRMPLPRTYGIDAKSKSSIQKATTKQSELYDLYRRNNPSSE